MFSECGVWYEEAQTQTVSATNTAVNPSLEVTTVYVSPKPVSSLSDEVVSLIASAPTFGTVEFTVSGNAYLDYPIMHALETRSDVAVKMNFIDGEQNWVISIPAGCQFSKLLDKDGKIGKDRLISNFGQRR